MHKPPFQPHQLAYERGAGGGRRGGELFFKRGNARFQIPFHGD